MACATSTAQHLYIVTYFGTAPQPKMKFAAFALLALLACAAVAFARQDEALDSMMLNELQPVNEPLPRLLAQVIADRAGGYGDLAAGGYGDVELEAPGTIPTTVINPPSPATAGAATAAASVLSFLAAAAMALAML